MSVLNNMEELLVTARRLNNSENRSVDLFEFTTRTEELKVFKKITMLRKVRENFAQNIPKINLSPEIEEQARAIIGYIDKTLSKIQKNPDPKEITKGEHWRNLKKNMPLLIDKVENDLKTEWQIHLASTVDAKPPKHYEMIANTSHGNKSTYDRYSREHKIYSDLIQELPTDNTTIQRAILTGEKLTNISHKFIEDYPPAVAIFLRKCNDTDGAALHFLTEEVLEWLKNQNNFKNYRIKIPPHLR